MSARRRPRRAVAAPEPSMRGLDSAFAPRRSSKRSVWVTHVTTSSEARRMAEWLAGHGEVEHIYTQHMTGDAVPDGYFDTYVVVWSSSSTRPIGELAWKESRLHQLTRPWEESQWVKSVEGIDHPSLGPYVFRVRVVRHVEPAEELEDAADATVLPRRKPRLGWRFLGPILEALGCRK